MIPTFTFGTSIEILLVILLVMTMAYCYAIDRKISRVAQLEADRSQLIEELSEKIIQGTTLKAQLQEALDDRSKSERIIQLRHVASPSIVTSELALRAQRFHEKRTAA